METTKEQKKNLRKLEGIKTQLMNVFNELYDLELNAYDAKNEVVRAINSVYRLMEEIE